MLTANARKFECVQRTFEINKVQTLYTIYFGSIELWIVKKQNKLIYEAFIELLIRGQGGLTVLKNN